MFQLQMEKVLEALGNYSLEASLGRPTCPKQVEQLDNPGRALRKNPERKNPEFEKRENPERNNLEFKNLESEKIQRE